MVAVSVSDFKKNIKKYTELSLYQNVIVRQRDGKSFRIVPIEEVDEKEEYLKSIHLAEKQIEKGQSQRVENKEELQSFLENKV